MTLHVKNSGAWSQVSDIYVKDAGTWKTVQNGYVKDSGVWKEFYASGIVLTISANTNNYNVFSAAGSPSSASNVIVNINSGVTVGATAGNTALVLGQFPTGSTITINNSGTIAGYGGTGGSYYNVGSSGGDAIFASYANQTVTINNQTGA